MLTNFVAGKLPTDSVFDITGKSISSKINLWAKKAGVPQLHPHSFRHKFATDLCQKGVDLRTVQELLGHESVEVTQRYISITDTNKKRAVGMLDMATPIDQVTGSGEQSGNATASGVSADDIVRTIRELTSFVASVGDVNMDSGTVLLKLWGQFSTGLTLSEFLTRLTKEFSLSVADPQCLWDAANSLLEELCLYQVIRLEQRRRGGTVRDKIDADYWVLTDYGKMIVLKFRRESRQKLES